MSEHILEIRHLSKTFGTHAVLKDIDFTVDKGDVTSIIGASGKVQGAAKTGAVTDLDGNFSISAASDATLNVSYVGYISQSVKVAWRS